MRVLELQAENEKLRAALEAVEWVDHSPHDAQCPWCDQPPFDGHAPDCQRQQALAGEAGQAEGEARREFLNDVIRAERIERDILCAVVDRDAKEFTAQRKEFMNLICSLSNRARAELGLPSIREESRADAGQAEGEN
jgi:hypothetical protein